MPYPSAILFRRASVIDGEEEGNSRFKADVFIKDGIISAITHITTETPEVDLRGQDSSGDDAILDVDASSLVLCPGFIDMHAHSDLHLLTHPSHVPKLSQGITTEVVGQDGISYAPLSALECEDAQQDSWALEYVRQQIAGWNGNPDTAPAHWNAEPGTTLFSWRSVREYLDTLDRHIPPTNVAFLVPQGNLRLLTVGADPGQTSKENVEQMKVLLKRGLDEGAVGMSSGLTYVPGMYADENELAALCHVLSDASSNKASNSLGAFTPFYAPHHRSYGLNVLGAYEEMLRIGLHMGCPIHLTHATLNFPPNSGIAPSFLELVARYEEKGVDVSLDTYPYLPGSTTLAAMLPSWALAGGPEPTLLRLQAVAPEQEVVRHGATQRLSGLQILDCIREDVCERGSDGCHGFTVDWSTIGIAGLGTTQGQNNALLSTLIGKRISEAASGMDEAHSTLRDPFHLFVYILVEDLLATTILQHVGNEDNVRQIMRHHRHMMGTDAILTPKKPHPRAWGSTGRYLGWYGRDIFSTSPSNGPDGAPEIPVADRYPAPFRREATLEDVIPHLTSRPARRLGLVFDPVSYRGDTPRPRVPRGLIKVGYAADIVLFHPDTIRDRATFANPSVPCAGIEWVLVNGKVAVDRGRVTGVRGGRTIRRDCETGLVW